MKPFESFQLNEDVDILYKYDSNDKELDFTPLDDFEVYPFGVLGGDVYVGHEGSYHDDDINDIGGIRLSESEITGRLWYNDNVISFWQYPKSNEELLKYVNEIFEIADLDSSVIDELNIEIPNPDDDSERSFIEIPISEFNGLNLTKKQSDNIKKEYELHLLDAKTKNRVMMERGYRAKSTKWKKYMKPFESKKYR
jgi:hypothetical protein